MRVVTRENFFEFARGMYSNGSERFLIYEIRSPEKSAHLRAQLHERGLDTSLLSDWQIAVMWYYFTDDDLVITEDVVSNIADSLGRFVAK